jgi:hypothetical protein
MQAVVETGAFERLTALAGERLQQRQLGLAEGARLGAADADRTQDLLPRQQRHGAERVDGGQRRGQLGVAARELGAGDRDRAPLARRLARG